LLVEAKAGVTDSELDGTLSAHGGRSQGKLPGLNVHLVALPPGQSERDIAAKLARHPHIKFAELDELAPPGATANDPLFSTEWHLPKIAAPAAWDTSTGAGTIIAILDTGIDASHPDLAANSFPAGISTTTTAIRPTHGRHGGRTAPPRQPTTAPASSVALARG
jgi:subtilisin family serine protease